MNGQAVSKIVDTLIKIPSLDVAAFEGALDASFAVSKETPFWISHTFELATGPFVEGEFALSRAGEKARLSLWSREEDVVTREDLDLSQWGELHNIDVTPEIPPEGVYNYIYVVDGVKVYFQFTDRTSRLRSVALHWGTQE